MRSPTYSAVVSTLALAVALGTGGAYAAGKVGTKDIANNAVTSAKIKNGTIAPADLSAKVTKKLKPGPKGARGPRGFSAWETIPSGVTVKGTAYEDGGTDSTADDFAAYTAFPGVAPAQLTDADVNFSSDAYAATTDDDPSCTGSYQAPTAPAGKVCLYMGGVTNLTNLDGQVFGADPLTIYGFYVYGDELGADVDSYYYFSWAYTAP